MDDLLIAMLNALSQGPTGNLDALTQSPEQYNSALYQAATAIHNTAVKPVTAVILSIVLTLMLAQASTRIEGDRELGVRIISGIMLKAALVVVFASNALTILSGIDEVATTLASGAMETDVGGGEDNQNLGDAMEDEVTGASTTDQLGVLVIIMLPYFAAELAGVLAIVLIFVRFLQMYLLTVFGSLPIAFLAYEETKQMGIGYLKKYGSVALSGVIMILAVKFYQALMGTWATDNIDPGDSGLFEFMAENFGMFFVAPMVLIFVLFQSTALAKALTGDA